MKLTLTIDNVDADALARALFQDGTLCISGSCTVTFDSSKKIDKGKKKTNPKLDDIKEESVVAAGVEDIKLEDTIDDEEDDTGSYGSKNLLGCSDAEDASDSSTDVELPKKKSAKAVAAKHAPKMHGNFDDSDDDDYLVDNSFSQSVKFNDW